jgi:3-hydroxy-9,10-secoandrosta-1,3,5(10)-triene-9,17-dione monooxygenase
MAEAMLVEYLAQSRKAVTIMAAKEIGTFQAQQIKLGEATAALNAVQAQIRAEAPEIQALAVADQSRTSYAIEISQQRCICGRARILGNPADFDLARIFLDIIVATRHITQSVHINTAEHGRARINLPLTNPSLSSTALSQH